MIKENETIIKETVVPVVNNIAQPVSVSIGRTIEGLWQLSFGWINHLSDINKEFYQNKFEEYKKQLLEAVENTPEEKRVEPDIQTVTLALEASKHCVTNDAVREMFVKLIASSANIDTKKIAHPSFPQIIMQLNAFDAKVLELFANRASYGVCLYKLIYDDRCERILMDNVFIPDISAPMESVPDYASSLTLLERLGLISIKYGVSLSLDNDGVQPDEHEKYKKCSYYIWVCEQVKEEGYVEVVNGVADLTIVGRSLLRVCFPEHYEE